MLVKPHILIFNKIIRFKNLSDVMVVGGNPGKKRIGTDRFGSAFRKIADCQTVCIRSGCLQKKIP